MRVWACGGVGYRATAAAQHRAGRFPDDSVVGLDFGLQAEGAALGVGLELGRLDLDLQLLADADRALLRDRVLNVDEADGAEGEAAVCHHCHVQRESQHMRVGRGQRVAQGEAADPRVGGDLLGVGVDVGQGQLDLGDLLAAPRHKGEQRGAGDHRRRRPRVERQDAGRALECAGRHQAPSRLCPQTRTTLPLTPAEAGLANQAIVSATSTGRPPCDMLFIRRPASRIAIGIAPVI